MLGIESPPTKNPKNEKRSKEQQERLDLVMVEDRFGYKAGHQRKVHHLFGRYFRVDYHKEENQNFIDESHFVFINDEDKIEIRAD